MYDLYNNEVISDVTWREVFKYATKKPEQKVLAEFLCKFGDIYEKRLEPIDYPKDLLQLGCRVEELLSSMRFYIC